MNDSHNIDQAQQLHAAIIQTKRRDDFALACISSLKPPGDFGGEAQTKASYKAWAEKVYRMADALLEARFKK